MRRFLLHTKPDTVVFLSLSQEDEELIRAFQAFASNPEVKRMALTLSPRPVEHVQANTKILTLLFPDFSIFNPCHEVATFEPYRKRINEIIPIIPGKLRDDGNAGVSPRVELSLVKAPIWTSSPPLFMTDRYEIVLDEARDKGVYIRQYPLGPLLEAIQSPSHV